METEAICYTEYFITKKRTDGKEFVTCVEGCPSALKDFIKEVHGELGNVFPNDWIYATILEAFEELHHDVIDNISINADCYYKDLLDWVREPFAHEACNEVLSEFGQFDDFFQIIAAAQQHVKERIYFMTSDFLENSKE